MVEEDFKTGNENCPPKLDHYILWFILNAVNI
jgi:hypothetical protein